VLNKITAGEVALPGDLVVFQGEEGEFRNKGNGKALKVTAYRYLPEDHYTLTQIFEILAIDGREVEPTILNLWSMRLNETLGGVDIGTIRKQITREDGVVLDVNMHIYMVRAGDVIACAEQDDEARGTPPTNISTLLDVPTVIDSEGMVD
jgi:hypothetical protein